jgi:hypothetical protein
VEVVRQVLQSGGPQALIGVHDRKARAPRAGRFLCSYVSTEGWEANTNSTRVTATTLTATIPKCCNGFYNAKLQHFLRFCCVPCAMLRAVVAHCMTLLHRAPGGQAQWHPAVLRISTPQTCTEGTGCQAALSQTGQHRGAARARPASAVSVDWCQVRQWLDGMRHNTWHPCAQHMAPMCVNAPLLSSGGRCQRKRGGLVSTNCTSILQM